MTSWQKFKSKLKKIAWLRKTVLTLAGIKDNLVGLLNEGKDYRAYCQQIRDIIKDKEIVLGLDWGGLGDVLIFSSLPRQLFEQYGINFYLAEESRSVFRHPDILKLCFELNPYFRGFKKGGRVFRYRGFARDKTWFNILTDFGGLNHLVRIEKQFGLKKSQGRPKIYYQPQKIDSYKNTVLIDTNFISGIKFSWFYNQERIEKLIKNYQEQGLKIEYVDPKNQDLFRYADMIESAAQFVTVLSGGAALAAALGKTAIVFLPENARGESVYGFIFNNSKINYV